MKVLKARARMRTQKNNIVRELWNIKNLGKGSGGPGRKVGDEHARLRMQEGEVEKDSVRMMHARTSGSRAGIRSVGVLMRF